MSTPKLTPGPWEDEKTQMLKQLIDFLDHGVIVKLSDRVHIKHTAKNLSAMAKTVINKNTNGEMLKALELALNTITNFKAISDANYIKTCQVLVKTIAKAKGES